MTNYRDLPPGRDRRLAYSRELQYLQELHLVSTDFQRLSIQPSLVRSQELRRRAAFFVSRPNNGDPVDYSDLIDFSDMPPLETVPESSLGLLNETEENSWGPNENSWGLPNETEESWHVDIVNLINDKLIEKSSVSINHFNDNFCVICQDNIQIVPNPKCIMRVLECTHAFHIDCVDKWFTNSKTCPTCKYTF